MLLRSIPVKHPLARITKFWNWKNKRLLLILLLPPLVFYFNMSKFEENGHFSLSSTGDYLSLYMLNYQYQFYHNRIRLWNEGRCIDSPDGTKLVVAFCDPDQIQSFSLTVNNKLVYDRTGQCVGYDSFQYNASLTLLNCEEDVLEHLFDIANSSYLYTKQTVGTAEHLCITPMSSFIKGGSGRLKKIKPGSPCLNDPVGITWCDNVASRILLIEELTFQEDRGLLRNLVVPPGDSDCDFKACGMNKQTPRIQKLPPDEMSRCTKPWECVTLVTKTARRPLLVARLAQSVRDSYGYDLPIAAYDDGPDDYSLEIRQMISQYPLLHYVVGEDADYGIGEGRNKALGLVKTKYFFLLDDDILLLNTTDMRTMIDILDTTDAALVGGEIEKRGNFAGLIKFGYFNDTTKTRKMGLFPKTCDKENRTVPSFPACIQCDMNTNIFMARTDPIKQIGGWDPELKILEHKDFFLKMKLAGLKVAVCHDILVKHDPPEDGTPEQGEGYRAKRSRGSSRFRRLYENRYNFHESFVMYKQEVSEQGEVMFYSKTNKDGFC